ncbi:MAG: toprim domain-containing protein [Sutterella wadsworthensis]|jgi:putative DNA primase/helicase
MDYYQRYRWRTVREAACGKWSFICRSIAPQLGEAIEKLGRHVPCPVHGGRDGFRVFKDFEETGGGSSNKDGQFANGISLLLWVTGQDSSEEAFHRMVDRVGDLICPQEAIKRTPQRFEPGDVVTRIGRLEDFGFAERTFDDGTKRAVFFVTISDAFGHEQTFHSNKLNEQVRAGGFTKGDMVIIKKTNATRPGDKYTRIEWEISHSNAQVTPVRRREKSIIEVQNAEPAPAELSESAERVWQQAKMIDFDDPEQAPARRYLEGRGIRVSSRDLSVMDCVRFHPNLAYFDNESRKMVGKFPALVFAIRRFDGEIVNIHRIYLSEDGRKAPVPEPKKMTAVAKGTSVTGGSIALLKPEHSVIGVAEGVETALAVSTATGLPVWSCVNATLLEKFVPPKDVKCILIFADKDRSLTGQKAAKELSNRLLLSGLTVRIFLPKDPIGENEKGVDWNDMLIRHGPSVFPKFRFV